MKRSKPTIGMKLEARRIGAKPSELGGGNLVEAKRIDRAIQSAATYAMMQERGRIRWAVINRSGVTKDKETRVACGDIMNDIEGPMSGAPKNGRVKK